MRGMKRARGPRIFTDAYCACAFCKRTQELLMVQDTKHSRNCLPFPSREIWQGSAPASRRKLTMFSSPFLAARTSGLLPSLPHASVLAPARSACCTWSMSLLRIAFSSEVSRGATSTMLASESETLQGMYLALWSVGKPLLS